jgi:hypothetical protein
LSGFADLNVRQDKHAILAVTSNGSGEQLLIGKNAKSAFIDPLLSIQDRKLYRWGSMILPARRVGAVLLTNLFQRWPFKEKWVANVNNMYVLREVMTDGGASEPVIVPWLRHVASETSEAITYRVGNSIFDARTGKPVIEFVKYQEEPIWVVYGSFQDKDVEGGTIFWKTSETKFSSIKNKQSNEIINWNRQDGDSLDRLSSVQRSSTKIPTAVQTLLDTMPVLQAANHPAQKSARGYSSDLGDRGVFELLRNSRTSKIQASVSTSRVGFALGDESFLDEHDYNQNSLSLGVFDYFFGPSTPPKDNIKFTEGQSGNSSFSAISYKDPAGVTHGGVQLRKYSVDDESRYEILNRTDNTVTTIDASGKSQGAPVPYDTWKQRISGVVARNEFRFGAGGDAAAQMTAVNNQREAANVVVNDELAKANELVASNRENTTALDMGAKMLIDTGVDAIVAESDVDFASKEMMNAGGKAASEGIVYGDVQEKSLYPDPGKFLVAAGGAALENGISDAEVVLGGGKAANTAARQNIQGVYGTVVGGAQKVYSDYTSRSADGKMVYLDKTRLVGNVVETGWEAVIDYGLRPFEKVPGAKALGEVAKNAPGKLFDTAESVTRSQNAANRAKDGGAISGEVANINSNLSTAREAKSQMTKFDSLVNSAPSSNSQQPSTPARNTSGRAQ